MIGYKIDEDLAIDPTFVSELLHGVGAYTLENGAQLQYDASVKLRRLCIPPHIGRGTVNFQSVASKDLSVIPESMCVDTKGGSVSFSLPSYIVAGALALFGK